MKNIKKYIGILIFVLAVSAAYAQTPPPPNNNNAGNPGNNPVGGGAPIGSGFIILSALSAAYGVQKFWKNLKL